MEDNPDHPFREKPKTTKQKWMGFFIEVGVLCLLVGIGTLVWTGNKDKVTTDIDSSYGKVVKSSPKADSGATPAPTPVAASTTEKVTTKYIEMEAPKSWRAVDMRSEVPLSNYPGYNGDDLIAVMRFVPENTERNEHYSALEPVNELEILGTTNWVKVNAEAPATAANKRAYLSYLASLKTLDDVTTKKCTVISFGGSVCMDPKIKPHMITTADGALSGLIYMTMPSQAPSYDPLVEVAMVGTVQGKPVQVWGIFRIYDKLYETLSASGAKSTPSDLTKIEAARKAYLGGNPSSDTIEAYERIVTVVKSIKVR